MKLHLTAILVAVVTLACASSASASVYSDAVNADGPIGYWRLGEAAGPTAYDELATPRNLSYNNFQAGGFAQPGAIVGDPDTAVKFTTPTPAYLRRATTTDFGFAAGQGFSFEYWMKVPTLGNGEYVNLLTKGLDDTGGVAPWYLMRLNTASATSNGKVDLYLRSPDKWVESASRLDDNRWHHVVGVFDPMTAATNDGVLRIYVDGTLEAKTTGVTDNSYGTNARGMSFAYSAGRPYRGHLDEFAVYGHALDSGEVALHYQTGSQGLNAYSEAVRSNSSLLGYWRLGENANAIQAADVGGRGNHMDYNMPQKPTGGSPGIYGGATDTAYSFDGVDDVLFTYNDSDFEFAAGESFSIEYWMNTTQNPTAAQNVGIVTKGYDTGSQTPWYLMRLGGAGEGLVDIYLRGPNGDSTTASTSRVNDGDWHHVVGVYDADDSQVRLYVDGLLEGSSSASPGAYGTNSAPLLLARHGGRNYQGLIDEFAIYRSALTGNEVFHHYRLGVVPEPATWTLLVIGGLGLLILRRRVRGA